MSAGTIAEFLASVGFKADENSLKSALSRVAAFGASMQLIAAGVTAAVMRVAESQVTVANQARQLKVPTERLEELRYMAEQTGAEAGALEAALRGLGDKHPGIKDTSALLEKMGKAMAGMTEAQQQAYARRMGIDPSLIPMLARDVSGLKDEFRQMYALAGTDAEAATEASRGFLAEIGKLKNLAGTLVKAVSLAFIGRIRGDIENLRKVVMENFAKIRQVLEFVISIVLKVASVFSAFAYRVIKLVAGVVDWFNNLDDGTRKLILGAGLLLAAWKLLNLGFLATPLGAIIAGVAALIALIDDYLTFMEGGESYFDWSPWAETINEVVEALRPVLGVVMGIGKGIAAAIGPAFSVIKEQLAWMGRAFTASFKMIARLFSGDFSGAADIFMGLMADMSATGQRIWSSFCEAVSAFFSTAWQSVRENFPDFAAWAENAAAEIRRIFGVIFDWIMEKIGWIMDKIGGAKEFLGGVADSVGGAVDSAKKTVGGVLDSVGGAFDSAWKGLSGLFGGDTPALTPGPAQAAAMTQNSASNVELHAKTEIHMHTADPIAAGNQAAAKQGEVNAAAVRNMKGAAR